MKYGDAIEEIKRILSESEAPHFICNNCGSIVIADSRELLNRGGRAYEMDKNDPRFRAISQEILNDLKYKHELLHSMSNDDQERKRQMELAKYGEALETILKLKHSVESSTIREIGDGE